MKLSIRVLILLTLLLPKQAYMAKAELPEGKQPVIIVTGKNEPGGIGFSDKEKSEIECALNLLYGTPLYKSYKQRLTIPLICIVNTREPEASSNRARATNVGYLYIPAGFTTNVAAVMSSLVAELENLLNSGVYEALNDRAKTRSITKAEFVNGYFNTMARATFQTLKFQDKYRAYDDKRYNNSQLKKLYKDFKAKKLFDPKKPKNVLTEAQFMNDILTPFLENGNPGKKAAYEYTYDQYAKGAGENKTSE